MAASAAQPSVAQSPAKLFPRWVVVVWLVIAFVGGSWVIYSIAEDEKPGYSFVSRLLWSPESVAATRQAAEERMAANIRRVAEEDARIEKRYAERRFVEVNTRELNRVYCQNTKNWQNLTEADKQRVRDYLKAHYALLIESDSCP